MNLNFLLFTFQSLKNILYMKAIMIEQVIRSGA